MTNEEVNLIVDYLGKTEDSHQSINEICNKIGIDSVDLGIW
jgi:hypothetical protein